MSNPFTCPHCGAQQYFEPGAPPPTRCGSCGRPLSEAAVAAGAPVRPPVVLAAADAAPPIPIEPLRRPGIVAAAGIIWIVFGGLVLLNGALNILAELAFVPPGAREAGRAVGGAIGTGLFVALVGGVFINVGVQTLSGSAKDTLGNGIGSIIFALLIGGVGLLALIAAGVTGIWWVVLVAVINLLTGAALLAAGVMALVGRDGYRLWRRSFRPPRRDREYR